MRNVTIVNNLGKLTHEVPSGLLNALMGPVVSQSGFWYIFLIYGTKLNWMLHSFSTLLRDLLLLLGSKLYQFYAEESLFFTSFHFWSSYAMIQNSGTKLKSQGALCGCPSCGCRGSCGGNVYLVHQGAKQQKLELLEIDIWYLPLFGSPSPPSFLFPPGS